MGAASHPRYGLYSGPLVGGPLLAPASWLAAKGWVLRVLEGRSLIVRAGERVLVNRVSLAVAPGQVLALLGANGAGKTTLLRVLGLLRRPDDGVLLWEGTRTDPADARLRRRIGYLGHEIGLYENLNARENLQFFAGLYGRIEGGRIEALIERVGLAPFADDRVRTYSRGMRQRLALARSLAHEPTLWLLDEPYTGLDVGAARLLDDLIAQRRQTGTATVLVTHDMDRAARLADQGLLLRSGRVEFSGDADGAVERALSLAGARA